MKMLSKTVYSEYQLPMLGILILVSFLCGICSGVVVTALSVRRYLQAPVQSLTIDPTITAIPLFTTTREPVAVPSPTKPSQSLTYEQITTATRQLTEIKRNEYYKSLIGNGIHGTGTVADVSDNGEIRVRIVSSISYDVKLQGVDKSVSAKLNLNDTIEFDGVISEVSDMFGSGKPIITAKSASVSTK